MHQDYIKKYGGKQTTSISGNTDFLIKGNEAGEIKLAKAKEKNIPVIDEDKLFEMVLLFKLCLFLSVSDFVAFHLLFRYATIPKVG